MTSKKIKETGKSSKISELRQDPVSGDWVLLAQKRAFRPELFAKNQKERLTSTTSCPFENPQKYGNEAPVLVYQKPDGKDWFLQVITNKFAAVGPGRCGIIEKNGPYLVQDGTGRHEVIILRDHNRDLADLTSSEMTMLLGAYTDRLKTLADLPCIEYVSIFHNHGKESGASVPHPHSQALALPAVPPDIYRSVKGSRNYFHENGKCIHCQIIKYESEQKKRVVFENESAIVFAPYASRSNFELRIFPKRHVAWFDRTSDKELADIAEVLSAALRKIHKGLNDPAFNFFLHTAPVVKKLDYEHYHWHLEILPKLSVIGGFELGTGIDIVTVTPEEAAKFLRKIKS